MTHPTDDLPTEYDALMHEYINVCEERDHLRALLAEQARTEPTGGFARLAPNALPVGTLYPAIYPAKPAAKPLKAEQAKDAAEDAELLDWIFRQGDEFSYYVIQDAPGDGEYVVHGMGCSGQGKTPRAAIRAAIIADLCGDVEPVAWGIFANNGNIRFWACDKASADSQAAKTGGDVEGIFRASTVAALKARVAELEKDAARLEFVCNSPNRMVERESGLWRVYEDVAPTDHPTAVWQGMTPRWHVTPREAIDAAITAALTKGQP